MILYPLPEHSTREFSWHLDTKTFAADASELRWPIGRAPLGRVYDDAADEGFTLVSHVTGQKVAVALDKTETSEDYSGGWSAMTFVPAERAKRSAFKVIIFND